MTNAAILTAACERLAVDGPRGTIGFGWEHLFHEVSHYVLAMGRAPALTGKYAPTRIDLLVSRVLDARYLNGGGNFNNPPAALVENERRTLAMECVLARRFGMAVDVDALAHFAVVNGNVPTVDGDTLDGATATVAAFIRENADHPAVVRAVPIAEAYIRAVAVNRAGVGNVGGS